MSAVLEVTELAVHHRVQGGRTVASVVDATLEVGAGEIVGLLGESGAGKTTVLDAVLGLLPDSAAVVRGAIRHKGRDILGLPARDRTRLLGAEIGFVPQDPGLALNPVRRVLAQVAEIVATHRPWGRARCRDAAAAALGAVGLAGPILDGYPHQMSGGQRQRVTIAQALCCDPPLLLADEPTAALDSVTQAELRALLADLRRARGIAVLLVTHDVGMLWALADRVYVMDAGRTVESGPATRVLARPVHPVTRALLEAAPRPRAAVVAGG